MWITDSNGIQPLGDGPRLEIANNLTSDFSGVGGAPTVSYVGPVNSGTSPVNNHAAVSGTGVLNRIVGGSSDIVSLVGPGTSFTAVEVFAILIGAVDAGTDTDRDLWTARYKQLIVGLHAKMPSARFLLGYINAANDTATRNTNIPLINAMMRGLWDLLIYHYGIRMVVIPNDALTILATSDYQADQLHLTSTGQTKIANAARVPMRNVLGYP